MPGALAVVGGAADEIDISIARGARSKDTWVISDGRGQRVLAAAPARAAGGADPRRRRSAEPRGRQLLLAGALRRAGRVDRAARRASSACAWPIAGGARSRPTSAPLVAALRAQTRVASGPRRRRRNGAAKVRLEPERAVREALFDPSARRARCARPGAPIDGWRASIRDRLSMDSWSVVAALAARAGRRRARRRATSGCSCWRRGSIAWS